MNSPDHRANLLDPRFQHVGVGVVWDSPRGSYPRSVTYTADFGYRG